MGDVSVANTIALVDDDRNILTSVSMALEAEGFAVRCYSDGAEALKGMTAQPVDLAVLDIKMPRMDGMNLLEQLRRAKAQIPVIFLTSNDDRFPLSIVALAGQFATAQEGVDAGDQESLRERLFDVVVGSHAQAEQFVDLVVLRGQKDHRDLRLGPPQLLE